MAQRQAIEITEAAHSILQETNDWSQLPRKYIAERLIQWFGHQPREVQAAIIMAVPDAYQAQFSRMMLELLQKPAEPPAPPAPLPIDQNPLWKQEGLSRGRRPNPKLVARTIKPRHDDKSNSNP